MATSYVFEPLMCKLPERLSAYAYDLRGHEEAESEDYDAKTGLKSFTEDLHALLQQN